MPEVFLVDNIKTLDNKEKFFRGDLSDDKDYLTVVRFPDKNNRSASFREVEEIYSDEGVFLPGKLIKRFYKSNIYMGAFFYIQKEGRRK